MPNVRQYLTRAAADALYQPIGGGGETYLTEAEAAATYLTQSDATTTYLSIAGAASVYAPIANAARKVSATLNFGASFTDKATATVTGQSWVTANSVIVAQVKTPSGVDPDELYLLDFRPVVSDLVAGVGFTVTLYSQPEARGTYTVMCEGVA